MVSHMTIIDESFDLKQRLVDKSIEAYIQALETINSLTIQYRIEMFCYLMCNSWELLLKAKIILDSGQEEEIYYKRQQRKTKRSLSLRDCLNRTILNRNDPTRRNIERIEELRDESVHLVISRIPRDLIGLFQASVVNYHTYLNKWFSKSLSDYVPMGMISIAYDMSPEQSDLSNSHLRRELGEDAFEFLSKYCADLKREFDDLHQSVEFSIGIEYRLALIRNPGEADIVLSQGHAGVEPTQIVQVPKDPSLSHPFRQKEIIKEAKKLGLPVNSYDIQSINAVYNIKNRSEYFYQGKLPGSLGQYSQAFLDWLVEQHRRDVEFFIKARSLRRNKS